MHNLDPGRYRLLGIVQYVAYESENFLCTLVGLFLLCFMNLYNLRARHGTALL